MVIPQRKPYGSIHGLCAVYFSQERDHMGLHMGFSEFEASVWLFNHHTAQEHNPLDALFIYMQIRLIFLLQHFKVI